MRKKLIDSFGFTISTLLVTVFLISCTGQDSSSSTSSGQLIRLGIQPNEANQDLDHLRRDLHRLTGMQVETHSAQNYEETVRMFRDKKIDFAFFSPVNFIVAEQTAGAKALLKKVYTDNEFYWSALIVRENSDIQELKDIESKRVAFVDPKSTSGFLYPRAILRQAGLSDDDYVHEFLGTHSAAVEALLKDGFDVAAVWAEGENRGAWVSFVEENPEHRVRVLWLSDPIPNDAFAVRSDFYQQHPDTVFRVMEALIIMSDEEESALQKVFDVNRVTTATSRHYDSVRVLLEQQDQ